MPMIYKKIPLNIELLISTLKEKSNKSFCSVIRTIMTKKEKSEDNIDTNINVYISIMSIFLKKNSKELFGLSMES